MSLEFREREKAVGPFSLDILAHDTIRDRLVIIENQLEATNHDHLGKLLTYAAGLDAKSVIWVAPTFRDQHRAVIDWLNAHTDENVDFFAVVLEAVQIDNSRPAVNFKVVAFPNSWQKTLSDQRADIQSDNRGIFFYQFNEALLLELRTIGGFKTLPAPSARYEMIVERTNWGVRYGTAFSRDTLRVAAWIVSTDQQANKDLFEALKQERTDLDAAIGQEITWNYNPDRLGQILEISRPAISRGNIADLSSTIKWAAQTLVSMRAAVEPRLTSIASSLNSGYQDNERFEHQLDQRGG